LGKVDQEQKDIMIYKVKSITTALLITAALSPGTDALPASAAANSDLNGGQLMPSV
jgi:hypothetical protein